MTRQHPFSSLARSTQTRALVLLTLFTIIVMAALAMLGAPLQTEHAPLGIVSFEFAKTPLQAQQMMNSWGQTGEVYAALNLGLDYLFLVLYSSSIALGCALIADTLVPRTIFSAAGALLSWAQFAAAGLDAVENFALIHVLLSSQQPAWTELAWWCALIKFAIVVAGLGYLVGGTALMLIKKLFTNRDAYDEKTEE